MIKPRLGKAHSIEMAQRYIGLGWTLKHEIYEEGYEEPCEYVFEWNGPGEPVYPIAPLKPSN